MKKKVILVLLTVALLAIVIGAAIIAKNKEGLQQFANLHFLYLLYNYCTQQQL